MYFYALFSLWLNQVVWIIALALMWLWNLWFG